MHLDGKQHKVNLQQDFIAPGNAGTAEIGINLPIDPMDFEEVKNNKVNYENLRTAIKNWDDYADSDFDVIEYHFKN